MSEKCSAHVSRLSSGVEVSSSEDELLVTKPKGPKNRPPRFYFGGNPYILSLQKMDLIDAQSCYRLTNFTQCKYLRSSSRSSHACRVRS